MSTLQDYARRHGAIHNSTLRCAIAEFLGSFVLLLFAVGAGCQSVLTAETLGSLTWVTSLVGGTLGLMSSIYITGGVSGGHSNAAVTMGVAVSGGLCWKKVPVYWFSQFLGSYLGSGISYWLYTDALKLSALATNLKCTEDLTDCGLLASVFAPAPRPQVGIAFADQVIGTALLVLVVLAACDARNMKVPSFCYAPLFAVTIMGINCAFGWYAGGVVNPNRDIGARLMAVTVGYDPKIVFQFEDKWYFLAPLFGPLVGGALAAIIYNFGIGAHLKDDVTPPVDPYYIPGRFRQHDYHQFNKNSHSSSPVNDNIHV